MRGQCPSGHPTQRWGNWNGWAGGGDRIKKQVGWGGGDEDWHGGRTCSLHTPVQVIKHGDATLLLGGTLPIIQMHVPMSYIPVGE